MPAKEQKIDEFLRLACLTYSGDDGPERIQAATEMLDAHTDLSRTNVWTAACAGDVDALTTHLTQRPELATAKGGPQNWEPLLYASYSRLNLPGRSTLDAARVLLQHGAAPNAHWIWGGQYRFTALTGAFGEGEGGPVRQPPHQDCAALALLLLKAGADPNDSQALYNTMFTPGDRCLELLLEFGLGPEAKCNWLLGCAKTGLRPNTQNTLHYQLMWAIRNFHSSRVRLLLDHGVSASQPDDNGTPWRAAVLCGHLEIVDDLLRHGATQEPLNASERLAAACMAGDADLARQIAGTDASMLRSTMQAMPALLHVAASSGRAHAVRCLLSAGWNINALPNGNAALHQAAWHGRLDMTQLLIELGADPNLQDTAHSATPSGWAAYAGHREVAEFLAKQAS